MPSPQRQRATAAAVAAAATTSSMSTNSNSRRSRNSRGRNSSRGRQQQQQQQQQLHHTFNDYSEDDGFSTEGESYPISPRIDRDNMPNNNLLLIPGMTPTTPSTTTMATRAETNTGSGAEAEESDGGWSDESGKNSDLGIGLKHQPSPTTRQYIASPTKQYMPSPAAARQSNSAFAMRGLGGGEEDFSRYDSERPDPLEMDVSDDDASFTHSALGAGSYLTKPSSGGLGGSAGGHHHSSSNKSGGLLDLLDAPAVIETSPAVMSPPGRTNGPRRTSLTGGLRRASGGGGGGLNNHTPFGARPPSPGGLGQHNARPISPLDVDDDDRPPTPPAAPINNNNNRRNSTNNISGPATGFFGYRHIEGKAQPRQQPFISPTKETAADHNAPHHRPVDPSPTVPHKYGLGAFSMANNNNNLNNNISNHGGGTDPRPNSPSENSDYSSGNDESNDYHAADRNRMMEQNHDNMNNNNDPRFGNGGGDDEPRRYSTDSEGFRGFAHNNNNNMPSPLAAHPQKKPGSTSSGSMDDDDIYMDHHHHEANNNDNNNNNNNYRGGRRDSRSRSPDAANRSSSPPSSSYAADQRPPPSPSGSGSRGSRSVSSHFRDEGVSPGGRGGGGSSRGRRTPSSLPPRSRTPSPTGSPYGYARDYSNDFDDGDRRNSRDRNLPPIVVGGGGSRGGGSTASLDHFKGDEEAPRSRAGRTTRSHDETATMSYSEREAKRSRKTITWLVIGLACALISLAALGGGLFGALYFANHNSNDNASAPQTIPPDGGGDSPQATIAPSGPSGPLPNATFPDIPLDGNQTTPTDDGNNTTTTPPLEPLEITDQALFDLVANASFDGGEAILVNGSPQNMAYRWLQNNDTLTIRDGVSPTTRHLRQQQQQQQQQQHRQLLRNGRIIQRYAMACFYYGAGGPGWIRDGWLDVNKNECEWPIDTPSDINCDTESNMVSIEFVNNRLSGQLVPEIGLLKKLIRLIIQNNATEPNLTGGIPTDMKALKAMRSLEITGNAFTQPLPDNLFNGWKVAATINLSNNGLPGAIPSSVSQLGNCTQFIVKKNQLTGNLPAGIANMTKLAEWDISKNDLTGKVTAKMCVALTTVPAKAIVDCDKVTCDCCEPCGAGAGAGGVTRR